MRKGQRASLKVISAELKKSPDQKNKKKKTTEEEPSLQNQADPFCRTTLGKFTFQTGARDSDDVKDGHPIWEEIFEFVYIEEDDMVMKFQLIEKDMLDEEKIHSTTEVNLTKYKGNNSKLELTLLREIKKKSLEMGVLIVELQWGEEIDVTPFDLSITPKNIDFNNVEMLTEHDDVYIQIKADDILKQTKSESPSKGIVIYEDEYLEFGTLQLQREIEILIFDKDKLSADDTIGRAIIPLQEIKNKISGKTETIRCLSEDGKITCRITLLFTHSFQQMHLEIEPERDLSPEFGGKSSILKSKLQRSYLPVKKTKKISQMTDPEREELISEQNETLERLREHNEILQTNLERLRNKHNETVTKMLEKKSLRYKPSEKEQELTIEINKSHKQLRELQTKASRLRTKISASSGYDRMKDLENELFSKKKEIEKYQSELDLHRRFKNENEKQAQSVLNEQGYIEQEARLIEENGELKKNIKQLLLEAKLSEQKTTTIGAACVTLEKAFRQTCIENNIDDKLGVMVNEETDEVTFVEFNPTKRRYASKTKKDPRLRNPIFRAIHEDKLKRKEDDNEEDFKQLEMTEENFKKLLDEWRTILSEKENRRIRFQEREKLQIEKKPILDNLKEKLIDRENLCRVINQKIKEFKRIKLQEDKRKERLNKQKMIGVEEEWESKFLTPTTSKKNSSSSNQLQLVTDKIEELNSNENELNPQQDSTIAQPNVELEENTNVNEDIVFEDNNIENDHIEKQKQRSEVIIGQRYNKAFELLFDDRVAFSPSTSIPSNIVRIKAAYNSQNLLALQFSYMSSSGEIFKGKLNGNRSTKSLKIKEFELAYTEQIVRIQCSYSKGIHWIRLHTSEGRVVHLGPNIGRVEVAEENEFVIKEEERVAFISGGFSGKSYKFTYIAFHIVPFEGTSNLVVNQNQAEKEDLTNNEKFENPNQNSDRNRIQPDKAIKNDTDKEEKGNEKEFEEQIHEEIEEGEAEEEF